ncbi:hypothetical protein B0H13DRAFT_2341004 [Mycena leptocephala]|nr:hypothetical protein B0H13DRAFT_2341004 [Mycena leptocephala]
MRLPFSIVFAVILALPTFAAPISNDNVGDEFALEVRAAKKVAAKKAPVAAKKPVKKPAPIPAKKVAVPAKKPAAKKVATSAKKPAGVPAKKVPVAAKKPVAVTAKKAPVPVKKPATVPAKKVPVAAKKPVAATAKKAPVPVKKPATVPAKKVPVAAKKPVAVPAKGTKKVPAQKSAPATSCPIPPRKPKTPVRRFLEYIGLVARTNPPPCTGPPTASTSTPAQPVAPAASASASAAPVTPPPPPPVLVRNKPVKGVACQNNKAKGKTNAVFLADIQEAVELARTQPIKTDTTFPHVFSNFDKVKFTEPDCVSAPRNTLLEHAVGRDMKTKFRNIAGRFGNDFGQFRVVITTPDANGATTFCGVITHGLIAPKFEKDLCK